MANVDNPHGFRLSRQQGGGYHSGGGNLYAVASGDSQVLAIGDLVVRTGTATAEGVPFVTMITAGTGNAVTGSVIGRTNGDLTLLHDDTLNTVASTLQYILVEDDPSATFEAQMDGAFAITDISNNANVVIGTSTVDGKSIMEVNSSGITTTATLQVKILRLLRAIDNEVGANARVEVLLNNHTEANNSAGIN